MELLSTKQAAEILGRTIRSVHNYIERGELRAIQVGGTAIIERAALDEFIAKRFKK